MVSHGATVLLCVAWWLRCGWEGGCRWASLSPAPAYELWLMGEGTEPSNRCCPVMSHCVGLHGRRPPFRGMRSPQIGLSALVLTAWVPAGPDLL
jgi:hypothetical protein